jgi:polysaccharide pyruvyl transferase WcaK-like protein
MNLRQKAVIGAGVSDPSFRVKHNPDVDYSQLMADCISVLQDAAYVGVRGPKSAKILEENGFPTAKVIGDPALSLCLPKSPNSPRTGIIAINLCNHGLIWGNQEQVNETIARLVQHLFEKGWDVEFIPMQLKDLQLGLKIIQDFNLHKVSIWREYRNIGKTINRIQNYDILVGQRLHSVVFACGCGVPSVMLEYQPKSRDFMESIGMQQFYIRTDVIDLDKVLSLIYDIEMNYVDYCNQLTSTCNHYRLLQRQAEQEVVNLVKLEITGQ